MISRKLIGGNGFIEHLGTLGDELSLVNALLVKRCEEKTEFDEESAAIVSKAIQNNELEPFSQIVLSFRAAMPKYLFALLKSFCTKYEQSDETAVDKDSLIVYSPIQDFEKKASILLNINQELLDSDLPQNIKKEMSSPLLVIGQMFTIDLRNLLTFLLEYKNTEVLELQEIIEFFSLLCNTIFPVTSQFLGIKNMQDSQTSSPIIEKNPLKDDSIPFHFSYEE